MSTLNDINFRELHTYVRAGKLCANDFAPVKIGGATCRLVALDAAGYGAHRLIDATDPHKEKFPTAFTSISDDHAFYQIYYGIERNSKAVGDLSIS